MKEKKSEKMNSQKLRYAHLSNPRLASNSTGSDRKCSAVIFVLIATLMTFLIAIVIVTLVPFNTELTEQTTESPILCNMHCYHNALISFFL